MIASMADQPPTPPEWIHQLIQFVTNCISADDPLFWMPPYLHDDGSAWHIEVSPSIYEEGGDEYFREYHVNVSEILKVLDNFDIMVNPEHLSITGLYEKNAVHLLILLQPDEDYIAEATEEPEARDSVPKQLLN